jgi:hypothetical protein
MKSDRLFKILLTGFIAALVVYVLSFSLIQHRRTFQGPWRVVFLSDDKGTPGLLIEQPKRKVSERIMFPNEKVAESNTARALVFDDPTKTNAPFGRIIFQDLTFLPGTVTLDLFGHEVELLPRVLIIDKQEYAWKTGEVVSVTGPGKVKATQRK